MTARWAPKAAAAPEIVSSTSRSRGTADPASAINAHSLAIGGWLKLPVCPKLSGVNTTTAPNGLSQECDICPLNRVQAGVAVRIKQLCAAPEMQNRLREIGLGEEQIVRLVTSKNNFICQVCNTRMAISEQLARMILVEPLAQWRS